MSLSSFMSGGAQTLLIIGCVVLIVLDWKKKDFMAIATTLLIGTIIYCLLTGVNIWTAVLAFMNLILSPFGIKVG